MSALLVQNIGYRKAKDITDAYEAHPQNPLEEKEMDLHNNNVGLDIGRRKHMNKKLMRELCLNAIRVKQLKVLKDEYRDV